MHAVRNEREVQEIPTDTTNRSLVRVRSGTKPAQDRKDLGVVMIFTDGQE